MKVFLTEYYLLIKTIHIIAMISWMAGLLYLPRLFVYHTRVELASEADETFKVMEAKLLRIIMNPAMIVVFITGIALIVVTGAGGPNTGGWMHAKLVLVLLLAGMHGMMAKQRKVFARGENQKSERFFRVFNEGPTLLMIGIVVLVVMRPF